MAFCNVLVLKSYPSRPQAPAFTFGSVAPLALSTPRMGAPVPDGAEFTATLGSLAVPAPQLLPQAQFLS